VMLPVGTRKETFLTASISLNDLDRFSVWII
jgi:hypothetical protein